MPQNLLHCILQQIAGLSEGNSQRKVAMMVGVTQAWILRRKSRNGTTAPEGVWWSFENTHPMGRSPITPYGKGWRLYLGSSSEDVGNTRVLVWKWQPVGLWTHCWLLLNIHVPARWPRLTLKYKRRRREWGHWHQRWDFIHSKHCLFSEVPPFFKHSSCVSQAGNRGLSVMVLETIFQGE